ncbi:(+)-neomenthol dehydrogenase [Eucalyptus grandis]|uniref:(+)-neomenthol dehydrogenase n=1 Tax=Eucalyptus grandis TaxID=71139 RepID=UPI00192EB6BC|nr:(+)-neomenthol dehydrogenase [Eucalyptus grandis]
MAINLSCHQEVCSRDGVEICRKLASSGVAVVLTARDEKRGLQAAQELGNDAGLSAKPDSVVNDAGLGGHITNHDACPKLLNELVSALEISFLRFQPLDEEVWKEIGTEDNGMAEECALSDVEIERADQVQESFLSDFKEGDFGKRVCQLISQHVGKVALNAYTRIMAKKVPSALENSVALASSRLTSLAIPDF